MKLNKQNDLQKRFLYLDGLRGVAAVMVAAGHMTWVPTNLYQLEKFGNPRIDYPTINIGSWDFLVSLTMPSGSWVLVFFLLSGFVLESSIERTPAVVFAKRRLLRIWLPAAVAQIIFFIFGVFLLESPYKLHQLLTSLPLVNGGLPGIIGTTAVFPVIWTLWYEARYVVVLFLCQSFRVKPQTRLLAGVLIAFCYSLSGQLFEYDFFSNELANVLVGHAFISIGGIFWHLYREASLSRVLCFSLLVTYFFLARFPLDGPFNLSDRTIGLALFLFTLCLYLESTDRIPSKYISNLGKYTFSIYLVHFTSGVQVYIFLVPNFGIFISILLSFISCILGVIVFYIYVEKPILKWIAKIDR
jgi:peptidoglycan/LPS O-acetylase OafA/YrhL